MPAILQGLEDMVNGYKIDPNQELIAIGVTNTIGTLRRIPCHRFLLALRPAVQVRRALARVRPLQRRRRHRRALRPHPAFFWIPSATLSVVIVHAVTDLVASPRQMYSFWCVSLVELVIWVGSVLVAVFATIEDGISTSVAASLALLLVRLARPRGHFLGRVTLHNTNESSSRDVYIPLSPNKFLMNEHVVYPPSPGMVVYRFEESFLYPNSSLVNDAIVDSAKAHTRRGRDTTGVKYGDRPWNDPGKNSEVEDNAEKPLLRAVVMAFLDSLRGPYVNVA
ncbi:uncharacterized protein TRAVEDRAFT_42704 [Trametes versicolor FP-101664 SS1]|uniref:uncharacterized protein n=1 Tax=Trametes versicolor (strain FP-101664) TaxID=717944 RepID=UPI0004621A42|nr:uncharacterized protein TRAVEDRAFT_42704 [Trametes versicolor FP-101664 SS1]EIW65326.1 hypothetical protein TRAVEDRAFT_42704 [Trametes versicolor FP-101664 SS1]